jgi:glycosyltransferase involved in cell wall biosynthesis
MSLYLIVTGDFVTTGGMDRANHALASYLARRGDEVHLVAHCVADDLLAFPNVIFHRVPKPGGSYFLAGPLLDRVGRHWARRICARGGRVIVNGGNCQWGDVNWVHYVHAAYTPEVAGSLPRRLKAAWAHRRFLAAERKALRRARVVIANSQRTARDLTERVGVSPDRIRVVYYGCDTDAFRPATPEQRAATRARLGWAQERPVVAFIGALGDRRKGFDTLFAAWQQLCASEDWDADLVVLGAGAELPYWQRRNTDAGLGARIHYLGFRRDVPEVLAACDALIAPTRYEAYGLGVQEAICCGLPAVVSANAGVAERVSDDLHPLHIRRPGDVNEVVDRLRSWSQSRQHFTTVAESAARSLSRHNWSDMADQICRITSQAVTDMMSGLHVRTAVDLRS